MASSSHNRNPTGRNQYPDTVPVTDSGLQSALKSYHSQMITNNETISNLLLEEHGLSVSARLVKKRRAQLGLVGSRKTMGIMEPKEAEQLVLNHMDLDAAGQQGPRTIRHKIALKSGVHLPRDFVADTMRAHQPEGFLQRDPGAKRIHREKKVPLGINERWSGDGHDKLYSIGFPIWAIVDDATGKWLDGDVVPSNRLGYIVAYLFLCIVEKMGGIPLQMTTDCGSETTQLHGLAMALRQIYYPEFDNSELPAHMYLRSVHNISIERSWLRLRLEFGINAVLHFQRGQEEGLYLPHDEQHQQLCQWLWPKLLRKLLKEFIDSRNSYPSRKDSKKAGPSGMSRNVAFALPERWGGKNCLLPIDDMSIIREIKAEMGGDDILRFPLVTPEFEASAQKACDGLAIQELNFDNVWVVFQQLLPLLYN